jgi:hypothetical protein
MWKLRVTSGQILSNLNFFRAVLKFDVAQRLSVLVQHDTVPDITPIFLKKGRMIRLPPQPVNSILILCTKFVTVISAIKRNEDFVIATSLKG